MVCIVVLGQPHQGDEEDVAAVLKFLLCCAIKTVSSIAGGFD